MGGVCFAAEDDEVRFRHPSEGGYLPPMGHPYGHPGSRPLPPRPVGAPPPRPGGHPGRFVDEREFMDQKFRRPDFDPRAGPGPTGFQQPPQERDVFGGRGMRPDKMREFGVPPSEDSTIPPFNHSNPTPPHPNFGEPRQHQPYHQNHESPHHSSPHLQHHSPQRPRKSPSVRPGYENHDDHMDGYDSPERKTSGHFPPERKQSGHFPPERKHSGHFPSERQHSGHFHTERKQSGHFSYGDHEELPRSKSLSERLKNYQRTHSHEMDPYGTYSKSADRPDNGTDEDFGHNAQLQRKKSLQERVAEFKEKRKNSQVRFDDESVSEASERNSLHKNYYAILEREASERHIERQGSDRSDESRRMSRRGKSKERRGYGFERPSPNNRGDSRKKSKRNSSRHRDEDYADKPRRKTRKPKDRHNQSPQHSSPQTSSRELEIERSTSGRSTSGRSNSGKRRSFIGRPKKSKEVREMEEVVRRISRRSSQRKAEEEVHGKKFTFDDPPPRRTSRRNNHDHEWAIHE